MRLPPAPPNPDSFLRVARTALLAQAPGQGRPGLTVAAVGALLALGALSLMGRLGIVSSVCLALVLLLAFGGAGTWMQLERARAAHPDAAVDGVRAVLRILIVFALVTPFWSLFDQKASTWVLQADEMLKPAWFQPAQMQALNPALVMILIPFNNLVLYPALRRLGVEPTALRRMGFGIAFSGLAWIAAGAIQLALDGGDAGVDRLAGAALRAAHLRRGTGVGHRPRVRLQPGARVDEGRDHGVLESGRDDRQPLGAAREFERPQRKRHLPHRSNRLE